MFKEEIDYLSTTSRNQFNQIEMSNRADSPDQQQQKSDLKDLMQTPLLRMNLLFSFLVWSSAMFNFYLITFYLKYFPGSIFVNSIWFALSDFFSFILSGVVLKQSNNPNTTLVASFSVSAVGGVLYLMFYHYESAVPLFIILSRVGNSMAFNTVYVSNNRFFPTRFQSSTYGLANFVSHVIAVGAPMLAEASDPYPYAAFLANSCLGAIGSYFLQDISLAETRR